MNKEKEYKKDLYVGIDVGSSAVHYVVLDSNKEIVYSSQPITHFANPIGAIREAWNEITLMFPQQNIRNTAFTGSGAESFPEIMDGVTYVYDSVAIPKGAEIVMPQAQFIFHIGAKDPYFFNLYRNGEQAQNAAAAQELLLKSNAGGSSREKSQTQIWKIPPVQRMNNKKSR